MDARYPLRELYERSQKEAALHEFEQAAVSWGEYPIPRVAARLAEARRVMRELLGLDK